MANDAKPGALGNISPEEWAAAYAPHIVEYPASRFVIHGEGLNARLAFGHLGPPLNDAGERGVPVFHIAITMSLQDMVALRDLLVEKIKIVNVEDAAPDVKSNG
ncbi:MAG: hypothetical protein ACR65U_02110 [Methylocystis sp.]